MEKNQDFSFLREGSSLATKMMTVTKIPVPEEFVQPNQLGHKEKISVYIRSDDKEPGVHRVEFVMWKGYWICNVEINGTWHTASFPNHTNMAEFLAEGQIHNAVKWPVGRKYTNE